MAFIPLHIRSSYTFLESGILFDSLFNTAKEYGYTHMGITDLNVMFGVPEFNKFAKKSKIKPIFGMDLKVEKYTLSLFAKNENGYQNLCQISSLINQKTSDYKETTFEEIKPLLNDLICVVSTSDNPFFDEINDETRKEMFALSKIFKSIFIGLEIHSKEQVNHANLIRDFAQNYSYDVVAFPFVCYLKKEDALVLDITHAIKGNTTLERDFEPSFTGFYFKNAAEIQYFYQNSEIENTNLVASLAEFDFDNKRGKLINYLASDEEKTREYFIEKINEGAKKHGLDISNPTYKNRLNKEFVTIKKLGYMNYFLVVADYVNYAKLHDIPVGPGRGSAAGSLIAYCLGITDVDPIKYNLLFERFLNIKRHSMPDIDIDISDVRREEVITYLIEKYGYERVARVCSFQTIAAKQAIRDIGRAFRVENAIINEISKTIPNNFKDDSTKNFSLDYAYQTIPAFKNIIDNDSLYKFVFDKAHLIESLPRQRGLHAAGVVLNDEPLSKIMPLDYESKYYQITQFEKDFLEDQGFLKMDLLGLSNLTVIDQCLKKIEKTRGIKLKMDEIPYDTPEIFDLIKDLKTMGLFQLDTSAAYNALVNIRPANFLEVVATISLDRPGPMQFIPSYSRRKEKKEKITYLSPELESVLKETYGIIVYQEQIMQIAQIYAGFDFSDADIFRKAISKKDKNELLEMKGKFISGAIRRGHSEKQAETLFNQIEKFANYGFNKSHAVSYAMIACKEAYLKANYPIEFYCAILDQQYGANNNKFTKYLEEINRSNLKVLLPDINRSSAHFEACEDGIMLPLLGLANLQTKTVINILEERQRHGEFKDFKDFVVRMTATPDKISESQLSILIDAGCFDSLYPNRKSLKMSIPIAIQYATNCLYQEGLLINDFGFEFRLLDALDDPIERLKNEEKAVGVMLSDSPLNYLPEEIDKTKVIKIGSLKPGQLSEIIGIVRNIKQIVVKNGKDKGKPMAFVEVFDETGSIDTTFFSSIWGEYTSFIDVNTIVYLKGRLEIRNERKSFLVDEMRPIGG